MALDAKSVLNAIQNNLSRQNYFNINIFLPILISSKINTEKLSWYIKSASLPSLTLNLTETKHLGKLKYAITSSDIDSINISFYDTKEQELRKMWVDFLYSISSHDDYAILKHYPNEYQSEANIKVHDTDWEVKGMTPISVGDFVLDYDSTDSLGTFDVTFKIKSCK